MPIEPPPDWGGLWPAVRPLVTWPVTDEDRIRNGLGPNWTNAGASLLYASAPRSTDNLTTGWPDDGGDEYQAKIRALRGEAAKAGAEMHHLGTLATAFAEDVAHTKTSISDLIKKHAWAYCHMTNFFGWPDHEGKQRLVNQLAAAINEFVDVMAARIAARGAGEPEPPLPVFADEPSTTASEAVPPVDPGGRPRRPESAPDLRIDDGQFGDKVGSHAKDYGLDPGNAAHRAWLRNHIENIAARPDEVKQGPWRGGATDYYFYRAGDDVVLAKNDGTFVTILKGGITSGWFRGAQAVD